MLPRPQAPEPREPALHSVHLESTFFSLSVSAFSNKSFYTWAMHMQGNRGADWTLNPYVCMTPPLPAPQWPLLRLLPLFPAVPPPPL